MARLLIHVEGVAEETFVNEILAHHLYQHGYSSVSARLIGNARQRTHRGGGRAWNAVCNEIANHLKEDPACLTTMMVDYYGLPQTGQKGWPGRAEANHFRYPQKATVVERALLADVNAIINNNRFLPFVMMHEFEGLLFSDCEKFSRGIGKPELCAQFQAIRDEFDTPEEINDSPETAPSKRVINIIPSYDKNWAGNLAILEIGLQSIRAVCPHFREWIETLERWPRQMGLGGE